MRWIAIGGILSCLAIARLLAPRGTRFPWRIVGWGLSLQLLLGLWLLQSAWGVAMFEQISKAVTGFLSYANRGAEFMFGNLVNPAYRSTFGMQVALIIAPTIIFFSSVISILYHLGIIQRIVYAVAWVMARTMRTSGPESLSAAANIFLGQTEAPILVRHYLGAATISELHAIMVGGFATIAGSVLGAYVQLGISAQALITASLLSAPGGLMLAKIALPPLGTEQPMDAYRTVRTTSSILDAATSGARDGLMLALNVIAMLLAFIALMALLDAGFGWLHSLIPWMPSSLRQLLGWIFLPLAYLLGVPSDDVFTVAQLLGTKIIANEFVAYTDLAGMIQRGAISPRGAMIATYALCGFANISSIAIQIGGIGSLVPERRSEIVQLGWRAMTIGALTNMLSASIAALLG
ncbi:MAG: nucleoside transporter C-terminal domain-containing protein [Bacteroidota bacterium]|nr:nucleoside transporter C-terminal domain-containing protein [Bacteroidota bacterium]